MNTLLLRCEATAALGTGHALRGLALAQAWVDGGGRALFVMSAPDPAIAGRLAREDFAVETIGAEAGSDADARATAALAAQWNAAWVALDGPMFAGAWDAGWAGGARLLRIDDNGLPGSFRADVLLNQNLGATAEAYPGVRAECRLLLGPEFALLRREFRTAAPAAPSLPPRLVITMGGSDPAQATELLLAALCSPYGEWLAADFIVGAANPRRDALMVAIDRQAPRLKAHLSPMNMPEVLRGAKLAVTAGGTTLYELASLGVPMVILAIAENQRPTCERFAVADAAGYAGWYGELTPARLVEEIMVYWTEPELLRTLATRARSLVDGRGAARVVAAMTGGAR